ncbi:MAG: uroporphyrinogen decarboxylase family protein [Coriobacteriales bacterium]|nr:uroporphyrinogen decarboxylase family protein [Coriobacteriales bacterium]
MTAEEEARLDELVGKIRERVAKEAMTPRQRFEALDRGETPDRIPILVNANGLHVPIAYGVEPGDLYKDPKLALLAYVSHLERFGYDTVSMFRFSLGDEEFGATTTMMADVGVPFTTKSYVETSCDIDNIKFPDPTKDGSLAWMCWMISVLKQKLGDIMPIWGFITTPGLSAVLPGSRDFSQASIDMINNPNLAHSLTGLAMKWAIMFGQAQLDAGADAVCMVDAPGMVSPKQFREFMYPYMAGTYHALDGRIIWAAANDVSHVMADYAGVGIKRFYLNSGQPLDAAKELCADNDVTLIYGIDPQVLLEGPKERIREEVRRVVAQGWQGGRFAISTETVDASTPMENVDIFMEAAREYCALPLKA